MGHVAQEVVMTAVWDIARDRDTHFPALTGHKDADVVVIGGGITGITTALRLAEDGKRVVVLESWTVGGGNTGGSTGNLYSTLARGIGSVRASWGDDVMREVVKARATGVDFIEQSVQRLGIDCQFRRCSLYFAAPTSSETLGHSLDEERSASEAAGLKASLVQDVPLPFPMQRSLKVENQAQFNPLRYVQSLARAGAEKGASIHEQSRVIEVDAGKGVVRTEEGEVHARHIVHATHSPMGINVLQGAMVPSREYGVTARLTTPQYPEDILWVLDPFHSIRSYHHEGKDYLVVVGEHHKTGENGAGKDHYARLEEYVRSKFETDAFEHRWSAQQFSSADGLPYIGQALGKGHVYVATGFAADGLTWGTVAGLMLSDLISGRDNPWLDRFSPRRFTPMRSAKGWVEENVSVAKHFVKDHLGTDKIKGLEELDGLQPGVGKLVSRGGEKLAVYRDEDGQLTALTAVCPHMKCLVHWNNSDKSWDCPCHGSRFTKDGAVIEGPAFQGLQQRDIGR